MAEPDKTIYRTTDPELVALWEQWQEARREFSAKSVAFVAEFAPAGCDAMVCDPGGERSVSGIMTVSIRHDVRLACGCTMYYERPWTDKRPVCLPAVQGGAYRCPLHGMR